MTDIQDYPSRLGDAASRKFGTFSYLPPLDADAIRKQVGYLIARGWTPAIEHTEPAHTAGSYWYMWKLPLFGEIRADAVLAEAAACHRAHPDHHVRLIGYDSRRQTLGASFVVYRGTAV